jgi:hypothetical protein
MYFVIFYPSLVVNPYIYIYIYIYIVKFLVKQRSMFLPRATHVILSQFTGKPLLKVCEFIVKQHSAFLHKVLFEIFYFIPALNVQLENFNFLKL